MEAQEIWKPVVGYEDLYEVSNLGRVKSLNYNHSGKEGMLKPSHDGDGYLRVKLCKNGEESTRRVHILVMRAFVGKCPDGHEIDHYDWNRKNNRLENLSYQPKGVNRARRSPEWYKTTAEAAKKLHQDPEWQKNNAEAVRKARCKPVDQYTLDGAFVKTWSSTREAARELGLTPANICHCLNGEQHTAGGFIWRFA